MRLQSGVHTQQHLFKTIWEFNSLLAKGQRFLFSSTTTAAPRYWTWTLPADLHLHHRRLQTIIHRQRRLRYVFEHRNTSEERGGVNGPRKSRNEVASLQVQVDLRVCENAAPVKDFCRPTALFAQRAAWFYSIYSTSLSHPSVFSHSFARKKKTSFSTSVVFRCGSLAGRRQTYAHTYY